MAYASPSRRRGNSILPPGNSESAHNTDSPGNASNSTLGADFQQHRWQQQQSHHHHSHSLSSFDRSYTGSLGSNTNPTDDRYSSSNATAQQRPQSQLTPPRAGRMRSGSGAQSPSAAMSTFALEPSLKSTTNVSSSAAPSIHSSRRTYSDVNANDRPDFVSKSAISSVQPGKRNTEGASSLSATSASIASTTNATSTTRTRASTGASSSTTSRLESNGLLARDRLGTLGLPAREREREPSRVSPVPPRTHSHTVSVPSTHSLATSPYFGSNNSGSGNNADTQTTTSHNNSLTRPPPVALLTPSSNGSGSSPLTSSVDIVGKRLREEQLQTRVKAAQNFIEKTLGITLPSDDLHESLKDGVILCKLANRLRPGTVQQISLKNLPFVKMENIGNFLLAARQLGVQSSDLFQTVDLYEGKDMIQVVSTILTLERVVGGPARIANKEKHPGPIPLVSTAGPSAVQTPRPAASAPQIQNRARSKTATATSTRTASATASIRPCASAYYAAQVRKLEEDSIRFANGYSQQDNPMKVRDRHMSTPATGRIPPLPTIERFPRRPSLDDVEAELNDLKLEPFDKTQNRYDEDNRKEQRELVFGGESPLPFDYPMSVPKSASGSLLSPENRQPALDMTRRKKKSISLDPQAANSAMGALSYRDGYISPSSPGLLTQSMSHNALSTMSSPGANNHGVYVSNPKNHSRLSSERTVDGSSAGTPISSRSTTPVQGLRKSNNGGEPLREKLELYENDTLTATFGIALEEDSLALYTGNWIKTKLKSIRQRSGALNLGTGQMVAVKRIKIDGLKDSEMDILMQEVDLLKSLAHPSIVKYEGFIKTFGHLNIILEFVENGSLLTTLKSFGTFPEKLVVAYVVKILEGLVYLHGKQVVHCDLKAANILTTKNGNVKLSDFGVSLNLKVKESDFGAVAGTPNWMAPEKDPTLRPSASTLGRHVWIKRNFGARELKPMDSLPYMKRKSLEPKEQSLITASTVENGMSDTSKRASTPQGLVSGPPPPPTSGIYGGQLQKRGTRRGSVDSASIFYSSATVPVPTTTTERNAEQTMHERSRHHQFVKSSFAKPVECRLCHEFVKNKAVICQDCSMVFHRRCQFYVGETCFPSPHLSYFPSPSPAQSVPNLKLLAGGFQQQKGNSRPSSRSSQGPHDRSRSVTPSQMTPRPGPTPTPTKQRRGSSDYRVMSPTSGSSYTSRLTSPENVLYDSPSQKSNCPPHSLSSRHEDGSSSPSLDGLRSLLSAQRRFSLGTKKSQTSVSSLPKQPQLLPTPPASYTSANSPITNERASSSTPDRGSTPNSDIGRSTPLPILKGGSGGRAYRGKGYHPGPLDSFEEEFVNKRAGKRRSSINLFSTSAPPVHMIEGSQRDDQCRSPRHSKNPHEDEDEDGDNSFRKEYATDMVEKDLEALLVPSVVKSPRRSVDAGHLYIEHGRGKSPSSGQTLEDGYTYGSSLDTSSGHGRLTPITRPSHLARMNGYHSSGSSSAAIASSSSYSSHTNNSSSTSSLGSVAAMLEEEDRLMEENQQYGYGKHGAYLAVNAYQKSTQPPQSHHVGIKTMLSRFSDPSGTSSNGTNGSSSSADQTKPPVSLTRHHIPSPSSSSGQTRLSGMQAVHPLQSPFEKPSGRVSNKQQLFETRASDRAGNGLVKDSQLGQEQYRLSKDIAQSVSDYEATNAGITHQQPSWKLGGGAAGLSTPAADVEVNGLRRNGRVTGRSVGQGNQSRWE
ncbi:hypothetical protein BGZ94_000395 [Podila epigama]|nr:hypothetical protein BGZ94_000395 [Podila epigama]